MEEREVVVVGAGPVGLCATLNLRLRGVDAVCLEAAAVPGEGSRAICFSKRTLEIFHALGAAAPMVEQGARWSRGKVYFGEALIHEFDLLPEAGHSMPAFINLPQYDCERFLETRLRDIDPAALRREWRVVSLTPDSDGGALLEAEADGKRHRLHARYVLACDGAKSDIRRMLDLPFDGEVFRERFLIADIRMLSDFPAERRFWFDPPFHRGGSALLHKQPDDLWRVDMQLGWHADPDEERRPENVIPRVRAMLGTDVKFELEWVSVYAFQSRRLRSFVCGDVFFAGDSAHQVSPFGARGANSGIEDADNLCWKLEATLRRDAPRALLETYDAERTAAADENMRQTARSTNFIAPQSDAAQAFRDAALELAKSHPFARGIINSGRLATAAVLRDSPLNATDDGDHGDGIELGTVLPDAPLERDGGETWMLDQLGSGFNAIHFPTDEAAEQAGAERFARVAAGLPITLHLVSPRQLHDRQGLLSERLGAAADEWFLARPDGHLCARGRVGDRVEYLTGVVRRILETGRA